MPLMARFTWEQDAASLALSVIVPNNSAKNADIYVSDLVVKVNSSPYVLLLDLFALVDEASVEVKAHAGLLRITLQKREAQLWPTLVYEASKAALRERRQKSMDRKVQFEEALADKRKEKKYQEEKQTLRAQMVVDDANRQLLQELKDEEKAREEKELYASFRELQLKKAKEREKQKSSMQSELKAPVKSVSSAIKKAATPKIKKHVSFASDLVETREPQRAERLQQKEPPMALEVLELSEDGSFDLPATTLPPKVSESKVSVTPAVVSGDDDDLPERKAESSVDDDNYQSDDDQEQSPSKHAALKTPRLVQPKTPIAVKPIPAPREILQSEIQFTPRAFPTPSRESKAAEEEDWLLKNRKHLNKHKGLRGAGSYDISESDPVWLKAKGDDFYRSRDYCSAVNAYSEAIALAPEQSDLKITCLSNRAATHLQLYDFEECIGDCSQALSYIPDTRDGSGSATSSVFAHYRLKLKLFVRRGTAYCRVGQYTQAKADYGVALSMDNQNPTLQDDFLQLVAMEKAQELKDAGDRCFREDQNQVEQAIAHYSDSLRLNPLSIACLSNRAACFLVQNALEKCVQDCTRALELLQRGDGEESSENGNQAERQLGGLAFFSVGPAPGSLKRRAWVLKTLVRRGTAYSAMGEWGKAEADYAASMELDPTNEALRSDLGKVQNEKAKALTSDDDLSKSAKTAAQPLKNASGGLEQQQSVTEPIASAC